MPRPIDYENGFTPDDVHGITGLSRPMVDYLQRHGYLVPSHGSSDNRRGKVRYYSYRDLVVARLIQRLRENGVQLRRIKAAVVRLAEDDFWHGGGDPVADLNLLVSDGKEVFFRSQDGFLDDMDSGQRSFAFVVNLEHLQREVRELVPIAKRKRFTMAKQDLEKRVA